MQWSQDFESGLADIDVQHRYIFALVQRVNQLDDAVERVELREVADELARLAICHFGCEERIMASYAYPEAPRHMAEHEKLLAVVREFQRSEDYHARQLAMFLCNWLVSHTMLEDRQLATHVLKHRAKAMGMSVSEFVDGIKLDRTSAYFLKARKVSRAAGE